MIWYLIEIGLLIQMLIPHVYEWGSYKHCSIEQSSKQKRRKYLWIFGAGIFAGVDAWLWGPHILSAAVTNVQVATVVDRCLVDCTWFFYLYLSQIHKVEVDPFNVVWGARRICVFKMFMLFVKALQCSIYFSVCQIVPTLPFLLSKYWIMKVFTPSAFFIACMQYETYHKRSTTRQLITQLIGLCMCTYIHTYVFPLSLLYSWHLQHVSC